MLTYSLLYTPEESENLGLNYVCSDNKIHVRFRDFNRPQIIKGFERKLTYLMTYLINYSSTNELFGHCSDKTLINAFMETEEVKKIFNSIKYDKGIDFKSFRFTPNYKRKENAVAFGNLNSLVFPLNYDEFNRPLTTTLDTFLNKLKISLLEYLFNDSYSIVIHELDENRIDEKFINKALRKANKTSDYVELW